LLVSSLPQAKRGKATLSAPTTGLQVPLYEQVASLLIALLLLIGFVVVCLLANWLSLKIFVPQQAIPVIMDNIGGGREDGVLGESLQIDSPDPQQIARETDLQEPQIEQMMANVLDAVSMVQADLTDPQISEQLESGGKGSSQGTGTQIGLGAGDGPGSGFPRAQRWMIQFQEGGSLQSYGAQLQHFGIELGAIGSTNQIEYAFHLNQSKPDRRVGPGSQEKRLYFSWKEGTLKEADQQLMQQAGIDTRGKILVQFYPAETENQLAFLEERFAGRKGAEIRRTRFGVRAASGGYAFYVIDQTYLR
jgi:hypothetical protein